MEQSLLEKLIVDKLVKKLPLWTLKVQYLVHTNPPLVPILSQMDSVYT